MKVQLQTESSECGLACLTMIASHYGYQIDLATFRRQFSVSLKGATLKQLVRYANALNLSARPLRLDLDELPQLRAPCILHWNLNHFVVLKEVTRDLRGRTVLTILDPAMGARQITVDDAGSSFTGVALELTPSPDFQRSDVRRKFSIRQLTGHIVGLRRAALQIIAMAFALELLALAAPLLNQFVFDEVIVSGDRELLAALVVGFALLMATQSALGLARSWFLLRWSMDVSFQWGARVFSHLTRLPVTFFEKRHLGDITSRFNSINSLQRTFTNLYVESALDSVMSALALAMMLLYSPALTAIVLASVASYGAIRMLFYQPFREAAQERLMMAAKEDSYFLETMRAITPLKLFCREEERRAQWLNLKADVQNRDLRTQKMLMLFKVATTILFGSQSLAVLYIGAKQVMQNALTIGMLMAFTSYATTFSGRLFNLIDLLVDLKMLGLHSDRLADIVMEEPERRENTDEQRPPSNATVTLQGVRFRYGEGEPYILDGVDLVIPAGQSVALIGPSGCGKTTLCKIVLGLLRPTEGEVLMGGIPIHRLSTHAFRSMLGTVMQDDVLLAGSILDNICFFDACPDHELILQCARQAAIHEEIEAMPMAYQTLVGDMGSSLSGGQRQRILLARALYKRPAILALDEATSHLDVQREEQVNQALRALQLTRIMIAHRPETIKAADRVIALENGRIREDH